MIKIQCSQCGQIHGCITKVGEMKCHLCPLKELESLIGDCPVIENTENLILILCPNCYINYLER